MKRGFEVDVGVAAPRNESVERALSSATAMGSHIHSMKMPWELNGLLNSVFGDDPNSMAQTS